MNTLRILLPSAVVAAFPCLPIAVSKPSVAQPPSLPVQLEARCTVCIDPQSKTVVRTVTIGVGDSSPLQSVATWVQWPDRVDLLEGIVDPSTSTLLPWLSSADVLRDRDLVASDVRVIVTARLTDASGARIYYGEEYFAIQNDTNVWTNWKIVMTAIDPVQAPTDPRVVAALAAEKALKAQQALRQAKRDMTTASHDGSQPRFGPSTGIKFFFAKEQGGPIQLKIDDTLLVGPAHGMQPLRLWLWVIPDASWSDCDQTTLPPASNAFYDYAPASGTIPVPYNIVESTFAANNMTVQPSTSIRVLGVVQERQADGTVDYRLHYSRHAINVPNVSVPPGVSPPVYEVMDFCTSTRAQGPPP